MGDTQGTEGQQESTEQQEKQNETTYTPPASQADLDRIINSAVARTHKQYEPLKAKAAEYDQFKESSKTEQQKAIDAAKAEGANEVTGKFTTRIVNAEIKATAAALGFSDPGDAVALFGDISAVSVGDDGPDAEAIKTKLADIAKKKPYLLKGESGPRVATRPKAKSGSESTDTNKPAGKSRAAAALREFSGIR